MLLGNTGVGTGVAAHRVATVGAEPRAGTGGVHRAPRVQRGPPGGWAARLHRGFSSHPPPLQGGAGASPRCSPRGRSVRAGTRPGPGNREPKNGNREPRTEPRALTARSSRRLLPAPFPAAPGPVPAAFPVASRPGPAALLLGGGGGTAPPSHRGRGGAGVAAAAAPGTRLRQLRPRSPRRGETGEPATNRAAPPEGPRPPPGAPSTRRNRESSPKRGLGAPQHPTERGPAGHLAPFFGGQDPRPGCGKRGGGRDPHNPGGARRGSGASVPFGCGAGTGMSGEGKREAFGVLVGEGPCGHPTKEGFKQQLAPSQEGKGRARGAALAAPQPPQGPHEATPDPAIAIQAEAGSSRAPRCDLRHLLGTTRVAPVPEVCPCPPTGPGGFLPSPLPTTRHCGTSAPRPTAQPHLARAVPVPSPCCPLCPLCTPGLHVVSPPAPSQPPGAGSGPGASGSGCVTGGK